MRVKMRATFATFTAPERAVKVPDAPWYLAATMLVVAALIAYAVIPRSEAAAEEAMAAPPLVADEGGL